MKIRIKSFNGIGDLLFVTPTLRRIKEAYGSKAHISVITNHPILLFKNPFVDSLGTDSVEDSHLFTFLGYPDPIHGFDPTKHHIESD